MKKISAFTLIELLVVIVIIGILATISTATFSGSIEKGRKAKLLVEWTNDQKEQEAQCVSQQQENNCAREIVLGGNTWSQYNTNIGNRVGVASSSELAPYGEEKFCISDDLNICNISGGLYTYEAALKLCPDGWKLPTLSDITSLITNDGFDVLGGNSVTGLDLAFSNAYCPLSSCIPRDVSLYWTSETPTAFSGGSATHVQVFYATNTGTYSSPNIAVAGNVGVVRCIKD